MPGIALGAPRHGAAAQGTFLAETADVQIRKAGATVFLFAAIVKLGRDFSAFGTKYAPAPALCTATTRVAQSLTILTNQLVTAIALCEIVGIAVTAKSLRAPSATQRVWDTFGTKIPAPAFLDFNGTIRAVMFSACITVRHWLAFTAEAFLTVTTVKETTIPIKAKHSLA